MRRDADIWDELQTLFHLAEATPELDRERVLAENCSDPELLRRVMTIFRAAHGGGGGTDPTLERIDFEQ